MKQYLRYTLLAYHQIESPRHIQEISFCSIQIKQQQNNLTHKMQLFK